MPADLHPKPEPKRVCVTLTELFVIAFIALFILCIIFVLAGQASYYYNTPLV